MANAIFVILVSYYKTKLRYCFLFDVFNQLSSGYQYLLSPNGIPFFGRSAFYRLALSTPLIINTATNNFEPGRARRALEATLIFFIKRGALKGGTVTQGYFSSNPEILRIIVAEEVLSGHFELLPLHYIYHKPTLFG